MGKRLTHEFVSQKFRADGYTVSGQYQGVHKKIKVLCPNSHEHEISPSHFFSGKRCPHCIGRIVFHSDVERFFNSKGYLLTSKYINAKTKLDYICPNGHRHSILYRSFKQGSRCPYCTKHAVEKETVKELFEKEGYTLVSEYQNSQTKVNFICPDGHHHSISYLAFKHGKRCAWCSGHVVDKKQVNATFELHGYKTISEYVNAGSKIKYVCPEGHEGAMRWQSFYQGCRCSTCAPGGYANGLPGRLYYLKFCFKNNFYYKIGITNKTIKKRFRSERTPYIILMDLYYDDGKIPQSKEQVILRKYKEYKYKGKAFLRDGNTELFTKDILGLDSSQLSLCEVLV
jgi:transcription initiation factor IIE alpha subunit